ncbi:LuxR C-terminal-related transcriptional regulator [Sulfurimonas sp.]|nr:LuxR C-terminal-related transcriptional regulator [Sulfurimonas sp.]
MKIILFSSNLSLISELTEKKSIDEYIECNDIESCSTAISNIDDVIVIADYDSISSEINHLISLGKIPKNLIVLEKSPTTVTGKFLILKGVKAYGNSRMLSTHYKQMIETVKNGNVWTYPELTAKLPNTTSSLNDDSIKLIKDRLTDKEEEVVYLILDGLTNDLIASRLDITTRTVKAHVSSIFSKLHVNDRISLILLLK